MQLVLKQKSKAQAQMKEKGNLNWCSTTVPKSALIISGGGKYHLKIICCV